ncbi:MAG: hypothetical protein ACR2NZ_16070 [Rubripirellula sp.]
MTQSTSSVTPTVGPLKVRVLRTLGNGRAARAQAVEAFMPDGRVVQCVEKVFAPGLLTRIIYRLSFQSPFAYQSNRDAILACFYRRRVAAAVLANSGIDAKIATPLYIRFDEDSQAWVLAAEWIQGRGIKPAPADGARVRRGLLSTQPKTPREPAEIDTLVSTMHQLEGMLDDCGLVGSGWQVAPRALVSTANLLRIDNQYTIIDLESGIPAVLVPHYLLGGVLRAELPPFDDLDADKLREWQHNHQKELAFRIGPASAEQFENDVQKLIAYTGRWKAAELAFFRRPWRLLRRGGMRAYQEECVRRWQQDKIIDATTAESLPQRPVQARLIWYAGLLPSFTGRFCSRVLGREDYRQQLKLCISNSSARDERWRQLIDRHQQRWIDEDRLAPGATLSKPRFITHSVIKRLTPVGVHRFLSDPNRRKDRFTSLMLLMLSPRYQSWFGQSRVEASVDRWEERGRITSEHANLLREDLSGNEVRAYTRGFGMHLALKASGPFIAPAKYGGLAAFIASGNLWFLLPLLFTPILRSIVTLANWWTTRHEHIPHGEALVMGLLPNVGSLAFPLQMFSTRPRLSTFLIRDAASKLGQRVPIYGGGDSRTEIALIRGTDWLVEMMQVISTITQRLWPVSSRATPSRPATLKLKRTRLGRWIDQQAALQIAKSSHSDEDNLTESVDNSQRAAS